ncbi:hypothetical protein Tco_0237428 [Tanacetum coccineum]
MEISLVLASFVGTAGWSRRVAGCCPKRCVKLREDRRGSIERNSNKRGVCDVQMVDRIRTDGQDYRVKDHKKEEGVLMEGMWNDPARTKNSMPKFSNCASSDYSKFGRFLGHIVAADGIMYGPIKELSCYTKGRTNYGDEVRKFSGLAGYYRRFVEGFSRLAFT